MRMISRFFLVGMILVAPHSIAPLAAHENDTQAIAQLTQEVRSLKDQLRQLQEAVNALMARHAVVIIEVPGDYTQAKADVLCHQLGGSTQFLLKEDPIAPANAKLLCRY
jgi:thiamine pyrophosphate-dependent acetolactate synthase large subunit-like protein